MAPNAGAHLTPTRKCAAGIQERRPWTVRFSALILMRGPRFPAGVTPTRVEKEASDAILYPAAQALLRHRPHARMMYLCILDGAGTVLLSRNINCSRPAFLSAVKAFRDGMIPQAYVSGPHRCWASARNAGAVT